MKFYFSDLHLEQITFVLEFHLDIVKIYKYTENEVPTFSSSKVIIQTETQTERHTQLKSLSTSIDGW